MIKNLFISRMRDKLKFYMLSGATFCDCINTIYQCINIIYQCINTIYQFIKPFLENEMSIFEEYGAFNEILNISKC